MYFFGKSVEFRIGWSFIFLDGRIEICTAALGRFRQFARQGRSVGRESDENALQHGRRRHNVPAMVPGRPALPHLHYGAASPSRKRVSGEFLSLFLPHSRSSNRFLLTRRHLATQAHRAAWCVLLWFLVVILFHRVYPLKSIKIFSYSININRLTRFLRALLNFPDFFSFCLFWLIATLVCCYFIEAKFSNCSTVHGVLLSPPNCFQIFFHY